MFTTLSIILSEQHNIAAVSSISLTTKVIKPSLKLYKRLTLRFASSILNTADTNYINNSRDIFANSVWLWICGIGQGLNVQTAQE